MARCETRWKCWGLTGETMTNKLIEDEIQALLDEINDLVQKKAIHRADKHDTEDPRPGFPFCSGCRLNLLTTRLSELVSARDDDKVPAHKEKSRRDEYLEHLLERRRVEATK